MAIPYAEVIGDPIGHSKSPLIHKFWLEKLGLRAEYRATRVTPADLPRYLATKRNDVSWRGCNVTSPLKQTAAGMVGAPAGLCEFVGAVNCVTRTPFSCLVGTNTDLAGIAEALKGVPLEGRNAVLIGAGGSVLLAAAASGARERRSPQSMSSGASGDNDDAKWQILGPSSGFGRGSPRDP